jgi:quinolinate synthase
MTYQEKIAELKAKHNAIIMAHNYQRPEVQDIADYLGDSLALAKKAIDIDADVIIFCGVDFMAESAKILNPDKTVIIPDPNAKCPMAAQITAEQLAGEKKKYPEASVVAYINTTAELKTEVDVCCTSANAVKVVESLPEPQVIFVPDENLGLYVKRFVTDKELILWPGYCHVHKDLKKEELLDLKQKHPDAEILVHPECRPEVIDVADQVFSTEGMVKHCKESDLHKFIIGTEEGLTHRLKKEIPGKTFIPVRTAVCPNMKKISLDKVVQSLETLEPKIELSDLVMEKAKEPLDRMVNILRTD